MMHTFPTLLRPPLPIMFYPCRPILFPDAPTSEHRASVKRFVSLQLLNHKTVGRIPWTGISPSQSRYIHRTTQTQNKRSQTSMP
jgi:hypothetical protein